MPILAAYPVLDRPGDLPANLVGGADPEYVETRSFAFRSIDGLELLPFTGDEFIARWGIQGLDIPARQLVEESSPGRDGTQVTEIRVSSRSYTLPLFIGSHSGHRAYLRDRARMRSFFNHRNTDYRAAGGTFDLVAISVLGERTLRSFYVDGMNGSWDQETSGTHWETFGLQALAQWPYWDGGRWATEIIRRPEIEDDWFEEFPPTLAANNLLNSTASFQVQGDVESYPRVEATGSCSSLQVIAGDFVVDVPDGLAAGETLLLDSDPRGKRVEFDGVTDWSRLSPLTTLAPLSPGQQTAQIVMEDLTSTTQLQLSGVKWYETPW